MLSLSAEKPFVKLHVGRKEIEKKYKKIKRKWKRRKRKKNQKEWNQEKRREDDISVLHSI